MTVLVKNCSNCKCQEECSEQEYRDTEQDKGKYLNEIWCNEYIWINEEM